MSYCVCEAASRKSLRVASSAALALTFARRFGGKAFKTSSSFFTMWVFLGLCIQFRSGYSVSRWIIQACSGVQTASNCR